MSINQLAKEIHAMAREKGWYDQERPFPELIALLHSEVSEALEEWRDCHGVDTIYYRGDDYTGLKPEGVPIELADVAIRLLDMCQYYGIDIAEAIETKMAYNATRPYRHGDKKA